MNHTAHAQTAEDFVSDTIIFDKVLGIEYNFDFDISNASESPKTNRHTSRSLSGKEQSTFYSHDDIWSITSTIITKGSTEWNNFREFIYSVRGGETFTLDVFGTDISPDNPLVVIINNNSAGYNHVQIDLYRIGFSATYSANL